MKVTLWMATSLNGIIATSDYKEDFLSHENWNEFVKAVQQQGCLIWGRKTYDLVRKWPKSYLKPFENIKKIIISTDKSLKLDTGFILASSPSVALDILEKEGFKEAILTGGSTNNTAFAKLNLIDEVILNIEGVIVGSGIPLFKSDDFKLQLKLISTTKVSDDIIQVKYLVIKN